jgi:Fe-S-cluster containining protein
LLAVATENKKISERVWYTRGLRFECQPDCANCCVNHGDYAYVYLENNDARRLARHLGLKLAEFKERYTEAEDEYLILRMDRPACPFLEGRRCTVYPARPTQCRTFPFWENSLTSRSAWKRLRGFCPGIDQGELHPLRLIETHLADQDS